MESPPQEQGIASDKNGYYYYAKTEQELLTTIHHMGRRISGIAAAISGLNRSHMVFDKAQICLPLPKGVMAYKQLYVLDRWQEISS